MKIKLIKVKPEFKDSRGFISRILDQNGLVIKSVLYIERKKGTISANHYHKKDTHYIFCVKGKVLYEEKDIKKKNSLTNSVTMNEGEMVKSNPYFAHSTQFLEDTILLAFSTQHRAQKQYEADTVRVDLFRKK